MWTFDIGYGRVTIWVRSFFDIVNIVGSLSGSSPVAGGAFAIVI